MEEKQEQNSTTPLIAPSIKNVLQENLKRDTNNSKDLKVSFRSMFTGPLPPPDILKQYKSIQPDFPERLLKLVEKQTNERHTLNHKILYYQFIIQLIGQCLGFLSVIFAMLFGMIIFLKGNVFGIPLCFSGLALLAGAYLKPFFSKKRKAKK